jgi:hypothetical protein
MRREIDLYMLTQNESFDVLKYTSYLWRIKFVFRYDLSFRNFCFLLLTNRMTELAFKIKWGIVQALHAMVLGLLIYLSTHHILSMICMGFIVFILIVILIVCGILALRKHQSCITIIKFAIMHYIPSIHRASIRYYYWWMATFFQSHVTRIQSVELFDSNIRLDAFFNTPRTLHDIVVSKDVRYMIVQYTVMDCSHPFLAWYDVTKHSRIIFPPLPLHLYWFPKRTMAASKAIKEIIMYYPSEALASAVQDSVEAKESSVTLDATSATDTKKSDTTPNEDATKETTYTLKANMIQLFQKTRGPLLMWPTDRVKSGHHNAHVWPLDLFARYVCLSQIGAESDEYSILDKHHPTKAMIVFRQAGLHALTWNMS